MIESCNAYKVGEQTFPTLQAAQCHTLNLIIESKPNEASCAEHLLTKKSEVLAILTMNEPAPKTRKPRSDQGKPHRKKRTPATEPAPIESTVEPSGKYTL